MRETRLTRRDFSAALAGGLGLAGCGGRGVRPNVVWITSEDNGPFLGCYGDSNADTPSLDRMAGKGVLYENAFAAYPVCAPSRSTLITGVEANSLGTGHMRSVTPMPDAIRMFPALLREAGYYCTNHTKQDYNTTTPDDVWDDSTKTASYRNRAGGQPFFHVVNLTTTHESSLFKQHKPVHDPARVVLPPYHPDTPTFRSDWAQYYDHVSRMDGQVGRILEELVSDGVAEDTIVFYFSDHGGILPRTKRFVYDSGSHVPLIIRFGERFRGLAPGEPGTRTRRLVSFVDFGPTVLSLVDLPVPEYMQGSAFLGERAGPRRQYVFIARDRMGTCPDLIRAVRDERFRYVRNYLPQLPANQYETYPMDIPSWVEITRLYEEGALNRTQRLMFEPKPTEELYDTEADPHEVNNLAEYAEFADLLERLRAANDRHLRQIRDVGFIPEIEMQRLTAGSTPYEFARDERRYPLDRILRVVKMADDASTANLPMLARYLGDENTIVQYWAAVGCRLLEEKAEPAKAELLEAMRGSDSDAVRMAAAEALCYLGAGDEALGVLTGYLRDERPWVRFTASVHLGWLGELARPAEAALREAAKDKERYPRQAAENALRNFR